MTGKPSGLRTHRCPPDHKHGATSTCYVGHRCGCDNCRQGMARSTARRTKLKAYNRYDNGLIDATPARNHLRTLIEIGYPMRRIAAMAGKQHRWIRHVIDGYGTQQPPRRLSRHNADAILSIPADPRLAAKSGQVTSRGARRRLQALTTLGWSVSRLQVEGGHQGEYHYYNDLMRNAPNVTREMDDEIRALYERLWNVPPTFKDGRERDAGNRAKARAAALGWAGPLDWTDIDLDDAPVTDEEASVVGVVDEVVVQMTVDGRRPRKLTRVERVETIRRLNRLRLSDGKIARMVACDPLTVLRVRQDLDLPGWTKEQQEAAA